jgi:hypothetical protein
MAEKIPPRALVDSGVFMRALEPENKRWKDKQTTHESRRFWLAALTSPKVHDAVLVSALTLLEFQLGDNAAMAPTVFGVEYVGFDDLVADDMSRWCHPRKIETVRTATGESRNLVKYDALIVACARAHRAQCIVTLDDDVMRLADLAGVPARRPGDFDLTSKSGIVIVDNGPLFRRLETLSPSEKPNIIMLDGGTPAADQTRQLQPPELETITPNLHGAVEDTSDPPG